MGRYDRIDMDNVFYADLEDAGERIKIKDAVDVIKDTALEVIKGGNQSEIAEVVDNVSNFCPQALIEATEYYGCGNHYKGQFWFHYLSACQDVYSACRDCIWEVRRALGYGPSAASAKLKLEKALVEVEWIDYLRMRDIGKHEKKYISDQAERVNKQIAEVKKLDPSYTHEQAVAQRSGCYVATAVYGSYDCPQVWTLRRYRDDTLAKSGLGRAFIHLYYAVSPTLVKWFGETVWFQKLFRSSLNCMVERLQKKGVADTPYEDRDW